MGYYRRIDVRMWGDARFRALPASEPSAQLLWVWLLTNFASNALGLYEIGEAAAAESLGWPLKRYRELFAILLNEGFFDYCWEHRIILIRKFLLHNPPHNANILKGWFPTFDVISECHLKREWIQLVKQYGKRYENQFGKWFDERLLKPFEDSVGDAPPPSPSPLEVPPVVPLLGTRRTSKHGKRNKLDHGNELGPPGFRAFWLAYPKKVGKQSALKEWGLEDPPPDLVADILAAVARQSKSDEWARESGRFVPHPSAWLHGKRWDDDVPQPKEEGPVYPRLDGHGEPPSLDEVPF